jgi:hypothetical protein
LTLTAKGSVTEFKQFKLDFLTDLSQQNQTALIISGSGTSEPATQTADLKIQLQVALPVLLKLAPQPGANLSSGAVDATATISQKGETQTIAGKLSLASLTGKFGNDLFQNYAVGADFNVIKNGAQLQSVQAKGNLNDNGKSGGNFDVSMNYDDKKNLAIAAKLDGLNENGLRPFLESALGDKKLVSIALNGNATAQFDEQNNFTVKSDLQLANLVVNDPAGKIPATPLAANFQLDVAQKNKVAELKQVKITLTPTDRAKNELQLSGTMDLSKSNAIAGNLKLAADSLDVTRYYDLFGAQQKPAVAANPQAQPANAAPTEKANQEPEAAHLPFGVFTVDATIGKFYLREIELSDLTAMTKIDGSHVVLNPCKFTMNGGPVTATADLNLGVPGYEYNFAFNANRVPIAPLANSFSADYKGRAKGDLLADINIKGAGTTGKNLKKTLTGNVDIILTNALIEIASQNSGTKPKSSTTLGFLGGQLGNLLSGTVKLISGALGLNELQTAPLTGLDAHVKLGGGKITATQVATGSAAFQAQTVGTVTIANVLTNSTVDNWPVHLALARNSAQRLGWVPPNAPANQMYFSIPDFTTLNGTIGAPGAKLDKVVLAAIVGKAGLKVYSEVSGQGTKGATNTVQEIQNLLNSKAAGKVLDFLKKK